jgi:hypothetical protein
MFQKNSLPPDFLSSRLQQTVNHVIITDASECDSELPESCLLILFKDLLNPSTFLSSLAFFESYSHRFRIPLSISIEFQSIFLNFLKPDLPEPILEAVLTIITQTCDSFSVKYDFTLLISHLWLLLPRNAAFDAISAVSSANIEAAFILTTPDYSNSISSLFSSNDSASIQGGLRMLESVVRHPELSARFGGIFEVLFGFHQNSQSGFRTETFEILETVISMQGWSEMFESEEHLNEILMVEEGEFAQLLAALRFLKTLLRKSPSREEVFRCSKSIRLIVMATEQQNKLFHKEVLNICSLLLEERFDLMLLIETGLPAMFVSWKDGTNFQLWNQTTKVLCELFMKGNVFIAEYLIGIGVVEIFVEALLLADEKLTEYLMPTLCCLIEFLRDKGAIEEIEKLAENGELLNVIEMNAGNGKEKGKEMAEHLLRLLTLESEV